MRSNKGIIEFWFEGAVALICDSPKLVSRTLWDSVISDMDFEKKLMLHEIKKTEKSN